MAVKGKPELHGDTIVLAAQLVPSSPPTLSHVTEPLGGWQRGPSGVAAPAALRWQLGATQLSYQK